MTPSLLRARFLMMSVLLFWCIALIMVRYALAPHGLFLFMLWNLFLALVPLFFSSPLVRASLSTQNSMIRPTQWACSFFWLLFLPNAPYLITDFVHLPRLDEALQWFDIAALFSFASFGLFCAYLSLRDVQHFFTLKRNALWGWLIACGAMMLCGFGIYLGRFLRWNSWDLLTRPVALLEQAFSPWHASHHPNPLVFTALYGCGLILGYGALHVFTLSAHTEPLAHTATQPQISGE